MYLAVFNRCILYSIMKKIFLIEDNAEIIRMYERAFRKGGYDVLISTDGKDALRQLDAFEEKPSIILLDIMIPTLSGLDVLRTLKADPNLRHIPVIILTNSFAANDAELFLSLGACRYLTKMDIDATTVLEEVAVCLLPPGGQR